MLLAATPWNARDVGVGNNYGRPQGALKTRCQFLDLNLILNLNLLSSTSISTSTSPPVTLLCAECEPYHSMGTSNLYIVATSPFRLLPATFGFS